jgi:hypothetical protein
VSGVIGGCDVGVLVPARCLSEKCGEGGGVLDLLSTSCTQPHQSVGIVQCSVCARRYVLSVVMQELVR